MEAIIGQLRYLDILFTAVVISVSILFAFFASRRTWVSAEIILAILFGGGFMAFPNFILAFQVMKLIFSSKIVFFHNRFAQ